MQVHYKFKNPKDKRLKAIPKPIIVLVNIVIVIMYHIWAQQTKEDNNCFSISQDEEDYTKIYYTELVDGCLKTDSIIIEDVAEC